ncbi:amidohydrolase [Nesterenkonia ebinurensis]|uniref:amidohydrolase n=1 Tax=Nesterenkonia ebinurensis TaxID=2608252 RepID=UPI001CC6C325|nr:amidohydrolase family protein [Nesterenkonia ebinurensis]
MPDADLTLLNIRMPGVEALVNVTVTDGVVRSVLLAGESSPSGVETYDAGGATLLPGMWDHHVHFTQWTIQRKRLDVSGAQSAAETLGLVAEAVPGVEDGQRLVGFGFRDGLWPDPPRLEELDAASGQVPTVLVSADLHCVWLNTAAQQQLGAHTDASGLLREAEAFAVLENLDSAADLTTADLKAAAQRAAACGVVGIVDFENQDSLSLWPARVAAGVDSLRVEASVWPDRLEAAISRGLKTGDPLGSLGLVVMGPLKVIVDGSLNTRTAWCWDPYPGFAPEHPHACGVATVPPEELAPLMRTAHEAGIGAAIHAIGDRANTAVLDTFAALGMSGSVEHAQLLRPQDIPRFAALGLSASVQPEHAMDDRDIAEQLWAGRTERAFAFHSLQEAGAELRFGSDAPVSPLDPWVQVAAAVTRSRGDREPWHPEQAVSVRTALEASTRGKFTVQSGDPADLILVEHDPLTCDLEQLRTMPVAATLLGGRFTHNVL